MGELRELALRVRASDHVDLETLISTLIERHKPEHVLEFVSYIITGSAQPTASSADSACTGMCGFVWKTGDTVYHCRTCGMDPSCAICHDCFINSDHTGHDYWMFSSGGGCCDCGDVEAWRREGFCKKHPGPPSTALDEYACDNMDLRERRCFETLLDAITAAYLHAHLLVMPDGELSDGWHGCDPRLLLVTWLTRLASTSLRIRSLVGVHLSQPRTATTASVSARTESPSADAPARAPAPAEAAIRAALARTDAAIRAVRAHQRHAAASGAAGSGNTVTPALSATANRAVSGAFAVGRGEAELNHRAASAAASGAISTTRAHLHHAHEERASSAEIRSSSKGGGGALASAGAGGVDKTTTLFGGPHGRSILDMLLCVEGELGLVTRRPERAVLSALPSRRPESADPMPRIGPRPGCPFAFAPPLPRRH
eukprot:jgi/Chrpa1/6037/Chrysochromulina_OHIO_Genome00021212-RA